MLGEVGKLGEANADNPDGERAAPEDEARAPEGKRASEDAGATQQLGLAIECGHRLASIRFGNGGLSDGGWAHVITCPPVPPVYGPIPYFNRMAERESR